MITYLVDYGISPGHSDLNTEIDWVFRVTADDVESAIIVACDAIYKEQNVTISDEDRSPDRRHPAYTSIGMVQIGYRFKGTIPLPPDGGRQSEIVAVTIALNVLTPPIF